MATEKQIVPTGSHLEARHLVQSIAAVKLYRSQIEVAKYLELAYLCVSDHPDVAKEVRLTAHSARTQHMMTTGLMKGFMVTAKYIVSTMIPMLFDAVDLEDKDLVRECFAKISTRAEAMKTEAVDTEQKYTLIQHRETMKNKLMKNDFNSLNEDCLGRGSSYLFKNTMQAYQRSHDSVDKVSAEKQEVLLKMQEQKASLGDARSLQEALTRLGEVDRRFSRINTFWDKMVVTLKFLKDDTQAGEVYLKKLENPKYAERFKASISRAENGWNSFGKICGDYVFACENDEKVAIKVLYNFLSAPNEAVPEHERSMRMRAIANEIEENIDLEEDETA